MYKLLLLVVLIKACLCVEKSNSITSKQGSTKELVFDSALRPLFSMTDGFISLLFPGGVNYKGIENVVNKTKSITSGSAWEFTQEVLAIYPGFSAAVVIGLLLLLLMPFIGCFCCCCRSCNKCGGKKMDFDPKNAKFKRCCWGGLLFITTIASMGGMIFLFFCASTIHTVAQKDFILAKSDQLFTDLDSSVDQIFGSQLTRRILDSVGGLEELEKVTTILKNLNATAEELEKHEENITRVAHLLNDSSADFLAVNETLKSMKSIGENLRVLLTGQGSSQIGDIQGVIQKMKSQNNISSAIISEIKSVSEGFTTDVKSLPLDVYSKYGWYGLLGIASLVGLIVLMFLMGLLCGCGDRAGPDASCCNKGCAANFLLAGVGLSFIFYSLLILITIILFAIGSLSTSHVCMTLQSPEKAVNDARNSILLQYIPINISDYLDAYSKCLNNQSAAAVAKTLNLYGNINIDNHLSTIKEREPIDISKIKDQLTTLNTSLKYDMGSNTNVTADIPSNLTDSTDLQSLQDALQSVRELLQNNLNTPNELIGLIETVATKYNQFLTKNSTVLIDLALDTSCYGVAKVVKDAADIVCNTILHPFNGFWFSLGWCLALIIFCIVLSLVLSSYFRRSYSYEEKKERCHEEDRVEDNQYEQVKYPDPRQMLGERNFQGVTHIPMQHMRNSYQDHNVGGPYFVAVNRAYEK